MSSTEALDKPPSPFEDQIKPLEEALRNGQPITEQTAYLLAIVNHYPEENREGNALSLDESLREVMLEGALGEVRKASSPDAAMAFAKEAEKQLSLNLEGEVPRYAQWQTGLSPQNRELLLEALINRFPELRALHEENVAPGALDPDKVDVEAVELQEMRRGNIPYVKEELTPEERFKKTLESCADPIELRGVLEDRSRELQDSIRQEGTQVQALDQFLQKINSRQYFYEGLLELINLLPASTETKSKFRQMFDVQVLNDVHYYVRANDSQNKAKAEGYYKYFSDPTIAAKVREVLVAEPLPKIDEAADEPAPQNESTTRHQINVESLNSSSEAANQYYEELMLRREDALRHLEIQKRQGITSINNASEQSRLSVPSTDSKRLDEALSWARDGEYRLALDIANGASRSDTRSRILRALDKSLLDRAIDWADQGEYKLAMDIANTSPFSDTRSRILRALDKSLLDRAINWAEDGEYKLAMDIANTSPFSDTRSRILRALDASIFKSAVRWAESGEQRLARDVANTSPFSDTRSAALPILETISTY